MVQLQGIVPDVATLGGSIVAVSPNLPRYIPETVSKNGLGFEVLSDPGLSVARNYGLVYELWEEERAGLARNGVDLPGYNGHPIWELPVTARYVIRADGTIHWAYAEIDHTVPPDPRRILAMVREAAGN